MICCDWIKLTLTYALCWKKSIVYSIITEFQLKQLNSSVITLLEELDAAPYLKTLPGEVSDVQKQVAQFGSRLTDLESQLTKSETELRSDLGEIKSDLAKTKV